MVATDGGKMIVAGNNKVIAARLSDAKFFWDQDRKTKLEDLLAETGQHHLPRQTRQPGRTRQAHRSAGRRNRQDDQGRCREIETRSTSGQGRSRHRHGRRIPRTARLDGPLLRARSRASTRKSPKPSAITTSRRGQAIQFQFRKSARPWRSPTSSTPSSASGPSTKSQQAQKILTHFAVLHLVIARVVNSELRLHLAIDRLMQLLKHHAVSQN